MRRCLIYKVWRLIGKYRWFLRFCNFKLQETWWNLKWAQYSYSYQNQCFLTEKENFPHTIFLITKNTSAWAKMRIGILNWTQGMMGYQFLILFGLPILEAARNKQVNVSSVPVCVLFIKKYIIIFPFFSNIFRVNRHLGFHIQFIRHLFFFLFKFSKHWQQIVLSMRH